MPVRQLDSGTSVRDVVAALFRRRRIIFVVFWSVLAGSLAGSMWLWPLIVPPRYTARMKFILKKDRFDAVVTPADRAVPGLTTNVSAQEIQSEIEILKSADVLDQVGRVARVHSAQRLQRGLVVEPVVAGRNITNLIAVRYSSPDREEVARVLDALPEIYLEKYLSVNRRPGALEYFRSQTEANREQLQQAEDEAAEFEKQQPGLVAEGQARGKLADLEKQRLETEAALRDAESRTLELTRQVAGMPAAVLSVRRAEESAHVQRLKAELLELENRRAQATFYRDIEQLERRIGEMRRALAGEAEAAAARVEETAPNPTRVSLEGELLRSQAQLAGLRARRSSLIELERAAREELAAARLIAAENAGQVADLARNVKVAEENFLLYRRKYTEAQEAETLDQKRVLNVAVAERPRSPELAERRSLWFDFAVGLLLALCAGITAGFAAEVLDHSIHTPRQLEDSCSVAVLAWIPESKEC